MFFFVCFLSGIAAIVTARSIAKAHFKDQETAFLRYFSTSLLLFVINEFYEFKFIWFVQAGLDRHLRGHGF